MSSKKKLYLYYFVLKIIFFILIFPYLINYFSLYNIYVNSKTINMNNNNIVHFINCGDSDAILIQGNGHFGLIDSSFPINKTKKNSLIRFKEYNVMIILKYLKKIKVKKLDFIIGTHAHIDHLGGIPLISKKYVDNKTKYFYKEYKIYKYIEIKKNYLKAINSIKKKNSELIDVTNRKIRFNFGEMNIELLNTFIDKSLYVDDNQNSILTLIKFKNTKLLLASDMTKINVKKFKNYLKNINILKLPHHGKGDISKKILNYMKPSFIIISSRNFYSDLLKIIKYMKNKYGTQILATKNIKDFAILLHFINDSNKQFFFRNYNINRLSFEKNIIIIKLKYNFFI